jgi:surface carbohydrate biosynthesis protein
MNILNTSVRSVILPSENQTREFDAKLLLAVVLAARGFEVVVGARHIIHNRIADFPKSIYMAKDFRRPSERILGLIEGLGHHIVAWDEEGFILWNPEIYYARRYSRRAIAHIKNVFAWGPANATLMRNAPEWPGIPIHASGNPRLDMLRDELRPFYADMVERLKFSHGDFVLFNSNFASFNPAVKTVAAVMGEKSGDPSLLISERLKLYELWKVLVPRLARVIAPTKLVVRPHPSESHDQWRNIAKQENNIRVEHEGASIPWILAAKVMLHSGCTTGVEAYMLGKPSLCFQPVDLVSLELDLPGNLSEKVRNEQDLLHRVQDVLGGEAVHTNPKQLMVSENAAYAQSGPLAVERIADVLDTLAGDATLFRKRRMAAAAKSNFRRFQKWLNGLNPAHKTSDEMNRLRYPGVLLEYVEMKVATLTDLLRLGQTLQIREHAKDVYIVSKTKPQ